MNDILLLKNKIKEYAWGSTSEIASLLGEETPSKNPQAELWMGTHPNAPSEALFDSSWIPLENLIEKYPDDILGPEVNKKYKGKLPFLFKFLSASQPLSIQAHPDAKKAEEGFLKENNLNIALDAPNRNYKDPFHKPEIICAITPLLALAGFRSVEEILSLFSEINSPELQTHTEPLKQNPTSDGLKSMFSNLWSLPKDDQIKIINEVCDSAASVQDKNEAYQWIIKLNHFYPGDIGVLSPILLNLVNLKPGEALFLPSSELHSYLGGVGIELMSNSDNVLRGGLTSKHMDVDELLLALNFNERKVNTEPYFLNNNQEFSFQSMTDDFCLSIISVSSDSSHESAENRNVEILICTEGKLSITDLTNNATLPLNKGMSFLIPASVSKYKIEGDGVAYKASTNNI